MNTGGALLADATKSEPKLSTRRLRRRPRRVLFAADVLSGALSVGTAYLIMRLRSNPGIKETGITSILVMVIAVLTLVLLARTGEYSKPQRISRLVDTGAFTRGLLIGFGMASLVSLLTKGFFTGVTGPSRLALGVFMVLFWFLGVLVRFAVRGYQRRLFAHGVGVRKVMVLGTGPEAEGIMDFVSSRPWLGVVVAGQLCLDGTTGYPGDKLPGSQARPQPEILDTSLDGLQRLDQTMRALKADEVIVALEPEDSGRLPEVTHFLSLVRVPFTIIPSLFEETMVAGGQIDVAPIRVLDMAVDPPDRLVHAVKRTTDILVALVALLALVPITIPIALAILAGSGRPVFYRQERLGKYGQRFTIHKFRTMVIDADSHLEQLDTQDEGDGPHFKMAQDPRLTRVGAFLRRWSLDELPQFWNVLKGDMSVVGPRPPMPREVAQYDASQLVRLKGKPGITGLWQVSGRKSLSFDDMVRLDSYYLEHWSLRLDLSIMLRTFSAVLTRRGAY
jgi:exopolysaccharide biosynthesis polyprenyl glycosylphosphotransferase